MADFDYTEDPYVIPGTTTLKNNLGITDQETLNEFQKQNSFEKIYQLRLDTVGALQKEGLLMDDNIVFGKGHLERLHYYIFKDIYPFAGQLRKMDTYAKGRPPAPPDYVIKFMSYHDIETELDMTLSNMINSLKRQNFSSKDKYAEWLSSYFEGLIYIHPFRDGNGRVIKEYLTEFVEHNNDKINMPPVGIDWDKMDKEKLRNVTYEQTLNPDFLEMEMKKGLVFQSEKENDYQERKK